MASSSAESETGKKVFKRILINQYKKFRSNNKREIIQKDGAMS